MEIVTAHGPHPALRATFPQEGKENRDFPSPLGRGQGEGPEQILNNSENTVEGVSLQWVGELRVKSGEHFFGEAL